MRRVVVTGLGVVSPVGIGTKEFWKSLCEGVSGVGRITRYDTTSHPVQIAGEVKGFDPLQYMEKKDVKKAEPLHPTRDRRRRPRGARRGVRGRPRRGRADGRLHRQWHRRVRRHRARAQSSARGRPRRRSPFFIPATIVNLASGQSVDSLRSQGAERRHRTACTTSAHAIGDVVPDHPARRRRRDDRRRHRGGDHSPRRRRVLRHARALARNDDPERASRPFDHDRDGFVIGEGSGILVLEELEFARSVAPISSPRLWATAWRRRVSHNGSVGGRRRWGPRHDGCPRRRRSQARRVDYVNAHGTSTPRGDAVETRSRPRRCSVSTPRGWRSARRSR